MDLFHPYVVLFKVHFHALTLCNDPLSAQSLTKNKLNNPCYSYTENIYILFFDIILSFDIVSQTSVLNISKRISSFASRSLYGIHIKLNKKK